MTILILRGFANGRFARHHLANSSAADRDYLKSRSLDGFARRGGVLFARSNVNLSNPLPLLTHCPPPTPDTLRRSGKSWLRYRRLAPAPLPLTPLRRGSCVAFVPSPSFVSRSTRSTPSPQPTGASLRVSLIDN
jgi:hypothetical protein